MFYEKVDFGKNQQMTKDHEKRPSMLSIYPVLKTVQIHIGTVHAFQSACIYMPKTNRILIYDILNEKSQ